MKRANSIHCNIHLFLFIFKVSNYHKIHGQRGLKLHYDINQTYDPVIKERIRRVIVSLNKEMS